MSVRRVALLTAGGFAPCLSSAVGGLIERYTELAPEIEIIAYQHGYHGLLTGTKIVVDAEARAKAGLLHRFTKPHSRQLDAIVSHVDKFGCVTLDNSLHFCDRASPCWNNHERCARPNPLKIMRPWPCGRWVGRWRSLAAQDGCLTRQD